MRTVLTILMLISTILADTEYGSFIHDGVARSYVTYLPDSIEANASLVLNLHGSGTTAEFYMNLTFMREVADTAGFIVTYPQGVNDGWSSDYDNSGFLSALIDTISADHEIDLDRVYICGWSAGGKAAWIASCSLSEQISKVACVAMRAIPEVQAACDRTPPMPNLYIHGTSDNLVDYYDPVCGAECTLDYWIALNGCSSEADTIRLPDNDLADGCYTDLIHYSNCSDQSEVIFLKNYNAGHWWPGIGSEYEAPPYLYLGNTITDYYADEIIWNFFNSDDFLTVVAIDEANQELPVKFRLNQNYPNPFNPTTNISYDLPEQSAVSLTVYDIRGHEVMTLQDVEKSPGNYVVQWNGFDQHGNPVSTGVYIARLQAGLYNQTIKMVYLR